MNRYRGVGNKKRLRVLRRDKNRCRCCGDPRMRTPLQIHHVTYRCEGGTNRQENLLTLCPYCHDEVHAGALVVIPLYVMKHNIMVAFKGRRYPVANCGTIMRQSP